MMKMLPATAATSRSTVIDDTDGPLVSEIADEIAQPPMIARPLNHHVPIRPPIDSSR